MTIQYEWFLVVSSSIEVTKVIEQKKTKQTTNKNRVWTDVVVSPQTAAVELKLLFDFVFFKYEQKNV